jgi:hypothetical protein
MKDIFRKHLLLWVGLLFVLIGLMCCMCSVLFSGFFFPIGPEGLSQRDQLVQQISQVILCLSAILVITGIGILFFDLIKKLFQK